MKARNTHLQDDEQVHIHFRGKRVLLVGTDHNLNGPRSCLNSNSNTSASPCNNPR